MNWWGEEGSIIVDGARYDVVKHGVMSGHWTLERDEIQNASAQKNDALTRTFEIQSGNSTFQLSARAAFGRTFELHHEAEKILTISPEQIFFRRATIEIHTPDFDLLTIGFAFWLVMLMWRRISRRNSGG